MFSMDFLQDLKDLTPCSMDVNSCSEALLHQDIINLVVVFPIWAVPCPSSGWFVRAKGVCQY